MADIPDKIIAIDNLPLTPNGKTNRKVLQTMAASDQQEEGEVTVPNHENEIQKTIYNVFAQILDIQSFSVSESFFNLGGHSLKAVELIEMLEQIFSKKISVDLIYRYPSVKQLASAIEKIRSSPVVSNLVCIQPLGHLPPFFCVHGDDANFFLPRFLGNDIPYYGFFHQGQNGEKINHKTITAIAGKYIGELVKEKPAVPYILGGYSIGGVIAFEMANQLIRQGQPVAMLFLIDTLCPGYNGEKTTGRHVFHKTENSIAAIHNTASPSSPISWFRQKIQEKVFLFAYYPSVLLTRIRLKIPISLRNSYIMGVYRRARKQYRIPAPVNAKAILFRSTVNNYEDYYLGWKPYFNETMKVYEIDADHHTIIKEPHVRTLAEIILKIMKDEFSK